MCVGLFRGHALGLGPLVPLSLSLSRRRFRPACDFVAPPSAWVLSPRAFVVGLLFFRLSPPPSPLGGVLSPRLKKEPFASTPLINTFIS